MKKQTSTLLALVPNGTSFQEFISHQGKRFDSRFGNIMSDEVEITLMFDTSSDAFEFYNEIRFTPKYQALYTIKTVSDNPCHLIVSGSETLFDYFGTREPNLLTASRVLEIDFKIDYVQAMTSIVFTGEVVRGELLGRHCIIEFSDVLPELSLGGLRYIARDMDQFDALLTRVYCVEGEVLR